MAQDEPVPLRSQGDPPPPTVRLTEADKQSPLWARLVQLYLHDLSGYYTDLELDDDGGYHAPRWPGLTGGSAAWLLRDELGPIGFIATFTAFPTRHVQQLFIAPRARGQGIAARVVDDVARATPGPWNASFITSNAPARRFWTRYCAERGGRLDGCLAEWNTSET